MSELPSNLKVNLNEVSQTIDVEEIAGIDLGANTGLKEAIGQAFIDFIVDRSKESKDINRKGFVSYKQSYKESDQFEAFAKTNKVDMDLTGNMLSAIEVLEVSGNRIKIGFDDDTNTKKAYNHMTGDTVRQRQFFGLREKDVKEVLKAFEDDISQLRDEPRNDLERFIRAIQQGQGASNIVEGEQNITISIAEIFNGES